MDAQVKPAHDDLKVSEPALADEHGIAGADRRARRNHEAAGAGRVRMRDRDTVAARARRKSAGDGDGALRGHIRHVRILAGCGDFTENKERTIGFDLDCYRWVADKAVAE